MTTKNKSEALIARVLKAKAHLKPETIEFLRDKKCIPESAIISNSLGEESKTNKGIRSRYIIIPVSNAKDEIITIIRRTHPDCPEEQRAEGKPYKLEFGSHSTLYGQYTLATNPQADILVCGGPLKAIAAQCLGFCAISGSAGEGCFNESWLDFIPRTAEKRKFIVCFDNDRAGEKGAAKVLELAGDHRPDLDLFQITLPEMGEGRKDITDFLLWSKTEDKKAALLSLAVPYFPVPKEDRLLQALEAETTLKLIAPSQGFCETWGFFVISLRLTDEGASANYPFVVTTDRKLFPCTQEEWEERGYRMEKEPEVSGIPRWEQKQLLQFMRNEGDVLGLADVFYLVRDTLRKYIVFHDPYAATVTALWICATYYHRLFPAFPYIHLTGLKGAAKTKLQLVISLLSFNSELVDSSATAAAIIRIVHGNSATLAFDEAEGFKNSRDENSAALQNMMRSGYKNGIRIPKCRKDSQGGIAIERFDPYSPKSFSGIKGMEDALTSRCIKILMMKSKKSSVVNTEVVFSSDEWSDLRAIMYPALLLAMPDVRKAWDEKDICTEGAEEKTIGSFTARDAEVWRPLSILAKLIGDQSVLDELNAYAVKQIDMSKGEETDAAIGKILIFLHTTLEGQEEKNITADAIFSELTQEDEYGWLQDKEKNGGRGVWLNGILTRLGVWEGAAKGDKRFNGKKQKYYIIELAKVLDAAERNGITLNETEEKEVVGTAKPESETALEPQLVPIF